VILWRMPDAVRVRLEEPDALLVEGRYALLLWPVRESLPSRSS